MTPKEFIRQLIPPLLLTGFRSLRRKSRRADFGLSGDYPSWKEALLASTGYDSEPILERTKKALLKVKRGDAVYERDSVLFDEIQYSWPLLAGLLWAGALSNGRLNVLDFGGSLGTTYFQNRAFLIHLPGVRWNVVEQPRHVAAGKEYFQDEQLRFYASTDDCLSETRPNVLILSGVLQYLEHPYEVLDDLLDLPLDFVVMDRTPFWGNLRDRLCIQQVPPTIYPASYPIWILSRQNFSAFLDSKHFEVVARFQAADRLDGPVPLTFEGMIMTRHTKPGI